MPIAGKALVEVDKITNDKGEPRCWHNSIICKLRLMCLPSPVETIPGRCEHAEDDCVPGPSCPVHYPKEPVRRELTNAEIIEAIEYELAMGMGAWDTVDPDEMAKAIRKVARHLSQDGTYPESAHWRSKCNARVGALRVP